MDDPVRKDSEEWVRQQPEAIHDLIRRFPPGCRVKTVEGRKFLIPAPGVVGTVVSYFEDETVKVAAELPGDVTNPAGETAKAGTLMGGQCPVDALEIVGFAETPAGFALDHEWANTVLDEEDESP